MMLSLRALARRAPRSASQLASYTTRSSIRPITQSFVKPTSILSSRYQPSKALFSTTPSRFDDAGQELAAKLEGEINIESENNESSTDSDSNVKTFFDQYDFWSAEDTSGEQDVLLKRSYDDEQIVRSNTSRAMLKLVANGMGGTDGQLQHRRLQLANGARGRGRRSLHG